MKKSLLFALLLMLATACNPKKDGQTFAPVTQNEVYDVLNAVIKQERLDTINFNKQRPLPAVDSLIRIKIYFPDPKGGIVLLPPFFAVQYNKLMWGKTRAAIVSDSLYFIHQNNDSSNIFMPHNKFPSIKIIKNGEFHQKIMQHTFLPATQFSVPVFSDDHCRAYVQYLRPDLFCECWLLKQNNRWQVINYTQNPYME